MKTHGPGMWNSQWYTTGLITLFPANHRAAAFGALGLGITTIMLFVYLLLTPWIKGAEPNVRIPALRYVCTDCKLSIVPFMAGVGNFVLSDTCQYRFRLCLFQGDADAYDPSI